MASLQATLRQCMPITNDQNLIDNYHQSRAARTQLRR